MATELFMVTPDTDPWAASLPLVVGRQHSGSFYPASGCPPDCSPEMPPACAAGPMDCLMG
ncbi:hypothetical protein INR49_020303 [Caranx melampygus]|nr:hypothetical protein INR49_020303 [Caranx melampygus]